MSHPPFNHNPHVYGGVDPAARVTVEQGVSENGDPTDSLVVRSDVARPADEEAAEPTTADQQPGDSGTVAATEDADAQSDEDADVDVNGDGKVDGYEVFTKADLVTECEARGLATSGNKPDLVRRLQDADAAKAAELGA